MESSRTLPNERDLAGSPERFGYQWSRYREILPESRRQLERWLGSTRLESFRDKEVLDVGCGMGRNAYWMLSEGARSLVAIDLDEGSLASARRNLALFPNVKVTCASAYELTPEAFGQFDRVTCIGVLHHLGSPEEALAKMWSCVKPAGELLLWCYGREGNLFLIPLIRVLQRICRSFPLWLTRFIAQGLAMLAWPIIHFIPWRTSYLQFLKTLSFRTLVWIIFDQIIPRVTHYWSREDIEKLLSRLPGKKVIEFVQGNSWAVRLTKLRGF